MNVINNLELDLKLMTCHLTLRVPFLVARHGVLAVAVTLTRLLG